MNSTRDALLVALALGATIVQAEGPKSTDTSTASMNGASPPTVLSSAQESALKRILAPYKPDALSTEDVRAIRRGLDSAGLKSGPALDAALAREGFSRKRMEMLVPATADAAEAPASPASRKLPRPQ